MFGLFSRWQPLSVIGAVLAVLVLASPAYAQGRIQGKVIDQDNKPIEGAKVVITGDNNRTYEMTTNDKGEYFQIGLRSGNYKVVVEKEQLGRVGRDVRVAGGRPSIADFKIVPGQAGLTEEQLRENAALQKSFDEAIAATKAGDHQTALAKYNEVVAGLPTCAECYYSIGLEHMALKSYPEAETAFKKTIELKPDHADAYTGLANLYNAQKKFDLAAEASKKAAELAGGAAAGGGNAESLYNQGVIAWNAGKADEAKGHFEAALKTDPNHAPSHFQLGMAFLNLGQMADARSEFETYLKLDPSGANAGQAQAMLTALPK